MSCRELVELVTEYFDGALDEARHAEFERHLEVCPGCVNHVDQLRTTLRLARDARELEREPAVVALLAAFRDWR